MLVVVKVALQRVVRKDHLMAGAKEAAIGAQQMTAGSEGMEGVEDVTAGRGGRTAGGGDTTAGGPLSSLLHSLGIERVTTLSILDIWALRPMVLAVNDVPDNLETRRLARSVTRAGLRINRGRTISQGGRNTFRGRDKRKVWDTLQI